MIWGVVFLFALIFLIDLGVYTGIRRLFNLTKKPKAKKAVRTAFWLFTLLFVLFAGILITAEKNSSKPDYVVYRHYFLLVGIFLLIYIPKLFFAALFFAESIFRYIGLILNRYFKMGIRSIFNRMISTKVLSVTGIVLSAAMFFVVLHGMTAGKTNFKIEHITLHFKNLPESFNGIRIGQVSDMHLGSFSHPEEVRKGIELLMKEKPDIIVLTGDIINNLSEEALNMLPELKKMHAPMGMFSILGNHDVGDYRRWKTIKEKTADFESLKAIQEKAGFRLLLDENVIIKKSNDSIALIGVRSWGKPPFKRYGSLRKAMEGIEAVTFKILLTHNPSHWDMEVAGKNNADLTLAGHTHAMQFGINCCGIFWCPLMWMYPHWGGLYNEGDQYLYVNRGFGYLGFPGRIGMTPEITIIELRK